MPSEVVKRYTRYGAASELFRCTAPEVVLSGPAGTGKSRACLEKLHKCALDYPGMRALMLRKTRTSLTQTALVTFEEKVLHSLDEVRFHSVQQAYLYGNGSKIVIGGLDKATKIMSAEYDMAYIQEAIEVTEDDWESVTTRLRNGVMPYQQLIADTNPDKPTHWLRQRAQRGQTLLLESRHEDNPTVTQAYLAVLDALTGVRYKRLRHGLWVAAEGMVYDDWDPQVHRVNRFLIPPDWRRVWSVDFGFKNPFCWQAWAVDHDERMYRYREIYQTKRLVEDLAKDILEATLGEPRPEAIVCDHDAEDRATLERHLKMQTTAAYKAISPGIQAVAGRLRRQPDGKARLFFVRDSLYHPRDPELEAARKPCQTEEEVEGYVWDTGNGRKSGELPVDRDNHGCDSARYCAAFVDGLSDRPVGAPAQSNYLMDRDDDDEER